ncbi:MAG: ABC transporter permease subunit [Micrococcales bacterium]|nr:ABC transporter permease subunit [Micrococcales bacterium]MCL2667516.1 ABC transporter permease subunit [Micrococcales bacterium]
MMSAAAKTAKPRKPVVAGPDKVHGLRWWRELGWRHVIGILAVVYALIPVLYIFSASVNPLGSIATTELIPRDFSLVWFQELANNKQRPFFQWLGNTVIVASVVVVMQVFFSTLAAFAFSRLRFKGRRAGLLTLLLIQMFPQILATVALFRIFSTVGQVVPELGLDTLAGYILVMMGGSLGQVWLIKGTFDTIPKELDEAAKIDGASHAGLFFRILLPLLRPILVITGLLVFVGVIAEFLLASIFLRSTGVKTVSVGMYGVLMGDMSNNLGWFAAASVVVALPVIILFQYLQRYIVGGITAGSVKG